MKAMIDRTRANEKVMAAGEWGLIGELAGGLAVGIVDPLNLIPIPIVKGIGIARGALARAPRRRRCRQLLRRCGWASTRP